MFKQSLEVGFYFLEQICHLRPTPKHIWSKWLLFHPSSFFPILLFLLLKRECFYPGTYCLLLKSQALKPQVLLWFKMYGTCISKVIWLSRSAFFYKETNKILKVKKKSNCLLKMWQPLTLRTEHLERYLLREDARVKFYGSIQEAAATILSDDTVKDSLVSALLL